MGVTIRQRKDKRDGIYYVFVSHRNRRTSFKCGRSKADAERLKEAIELILGLDKVVFGMLPRATLRKFDRGILPTKREADDLLLRIDRLIEHVTMVREKVTDQRVENFIKKEKRGR